MHVEGEAPQQHQEATAKKDLDLAPPPTPEELHIANNILFIRRVTEERWVFKYKAPWGPNKPRRLSGFYTTKTNAARALVVWCCADWRNRVETKGGKGPSSGGRAGREQPGQRSPDQSCSEGVQDCNCQMVAEQIEPRGGAGR